MSEFTAVSALLRGATASFETLAATQRLWRNHEVIRQMNAYRAKASRPHQLWADTVLATGAYQPTLQPSVQVSAGKLWVRNPAKLRFERGQYVLVADGERWWETGLPVGPVAGNDRRIVKGKLELEGVAFMLDPSYFASLEGLATVGIETVGGRRAIRLRSRVSAKPPEDISPGIGWVPVSGEFELWVDADRGLLLRTAERFMSRDYRISELLELGFDRPIADEMFTLRLPPGQEFSPYEHAYPRQISLEEAVQRAPFTVFVPREVPPEAGSWNGVVLFDPLGAWLSMAFVDRARVPTTRLDITEESGSTGSEEDLIGYQRVDLGTESMLLRSTETEFGTLHNILLSRLGTRIAIESMLSQDASIGVALSLRPIVE